MMESIAGADYFPPAVRYGAAAQVIVLYAKVEKQSALASMRRWLDVADELMKASKAVLDPLLTSVYWRAAAFIPFFEGDHAEVDRHLKLALACAMESLGSVDPDDQLRALENVHPLLETSGRSAKARGDKAGAERFYRRMLEWDPLDPRGHIRMGDFLKGEGRLIEARRAYQAAASIGAPYTAYSHYQAARCSIWLEQADEAYGPLVASAMTDRRALSPLIALRDSCTAEKLRPLREWAVNELAARMQGTP
ncbi:hypothetical protein ACL02T_29765 [Pseudonocardia sp. RS010]|uniref:hypothetical protein n=1 Tax=Pseudonocardia sp. RS010 TaxID=3385979 RepID=UPI0039A167CB